MVFNDCSKAETKKTPPEEERELTPQEIYDTMLRPGLEHFETQPEEGQEEGQDTQPWS